MYRKLLERTDKVATVGDLFDSIREAKISIINGRESLAEIGQIMRKFVKKTEDNNKNIDKIMKQMTLFKNDILVNEGFFFGDEAPRPGTHQADRRSARLQTARPAAKRYNQKEMHKVKSVQQILGTANWDK